MEGFEREFERERVDAFESGWGKFVEVGERSEGRGCRTTRQFEERLR